MMKHIFKVGAGVAALVVVAACQDLNVPNTNDPDRLRALANPADVEALVGAQFRVLFVRLENANTVFRTAPLVADEMTGTYANEGALEASSEPRVEFNNNTEADIAGMSRFAYREFNSIIASANDALNVISDGLIIETPVSETITTLADNTFRTQTFAHFMKAVGQGYLSMYFDSAFVIDTAEQRDIASGALDAKTLPLHPYLQVRDSAVRTMEQAIAMADLPNPFILPANVYFRTREVDDVLLSQLGHSYIARFYVYGARSPAERAALDWDKVLFHLDRAITGDFAIPLLSNVLTAGYLSLISNANSFSARADYKMIGPADQPGKRLGCQTDACATNPAYSEWIKTPLRDRQRFDIITPDRRITGALSTDAGTYFRYRVNDVMTPTRGTYHFSAYQWSRNTSSTTGNVIFISKAEIDLMKAEAYYYKGDLVKAAQFVSLTRANGQLEPIGPEGDQSADCVPRRTDGTCGNLFDAIVYERTVEGAGQDGLRAYLDARGLGRLVQGTIIHLPLSIDELIALNRPAYTYGGIGNPGSTPKCTTVTITCHPNYD